MNENGAVMGFSTRTTMKVWVCRQLPFGYLAAVVGPIVLSVPRDAKTHKQPANRAAGQEQNQQHWTI